MAEIVSDSRRRVPAHTSADVNRRIERELACNIYYYSEHLDEIPARLRELDEEWDIERAIEANAAVIAVAGTALATIRHRGWMILPILVTAFLLQHAVQGWCPPVPILRRLGFRTAHEIELERQSLKALRGDYATASQKDGGASAALQAARA